MLALLGTALPMNPAEVLLSRKSLAVTLRRDYRACMNTRIVASFDAVVPGGVRFVQFIPSTATGHLLMVPAEEGDSGAVAIDRVGTGSAAMVTMRAALAGFHLEFPSKRSLSLPFAILPTGKEKPAGVAVVQVQRKVGRKRARSAKAPPAAQAQPPHCASPGAALRRRGFVIAY